MGRGALAASAVPGAVLASEGVAQGAAKAGRFPDGIDDLADGIFDIRGRLREAIWGDFDTEKMDSAEALGNMGHDPDVAEFFDLTSLAGVAGEGDQAALVADLVGSDAVDGEALGELLGILEGIVSNIPF